MKKWISFLILTAIAVSPLVFAGEVKDAPKSAPADSMNKAGMVKMYQCPMNDYISNEPGKCPKCGMELKETEMTAEEAKAVMER